MRPLAKNPTLNRSIWFLLTSLLGLLGAAACLFLATPLPWLIGPLVAVAAMRLAGFSFWCPVPIRCAGQWVIGCALGLYFTLEVLHSLHSLWWAVLLSVTFAFLLGLGFAWILWRFAGFDVTTAFFAGAIGSASEMAVQGERYGGRVEFIASVHSVRLLIVVVVLPFAYRYLGLEGEVLVFDPSQTMPIGGLILLSVVTLSAALLIQSFNWPNAWVIGPLFVAGAITAIGWSPGSLPGWLINLGQLFIGIALGSRFRPESINEIRKAMALVTWATFVLIAISAVFGALLARVLSVEPATMMLATSPGGIAEMSLTAKILGFGVPIVTIFHISRLVFMVLLLGKIYRAIAVRMNWPIE